MAKIPYQNKYKWNKDLLLAWQVSETLFKILEIVNYTGLGVRLKTGSMYENHKKMSTVLFNPYKTGPFGEPIKNGLLGRFPTLRKDDTDVE